MCGWSRAGALKGSWRLPLSPYVAVEESKAQRGEGIYSRLEPKAPASSLQVGIMALAQIIKSNHGNLLKTCNIHCGKHFIGLISFYPYII